MPRRPRVVIPGVAHHITQRGNNRQQTFFSNGHRRLYLDLLTHHAARQHVRILGYCLMPNHVHLAAVPESEDGLARALGPTHSEYALALNRSGERTGHLWQNRFFSCALDESHLVTALRYIDLNPVRASLTDVAWDWPWSSARAHAIAGTCDPVLDPEWSEYTGFWNTAEWRDILTSAVPDGRAVDLRRATSTGEPLGSRDFVASLEHEVGRKLRVLGRGRPRKVREGSLETVASVGLFDV